VEVIIDDEHMAILTCEKASFSQLPAVGYYNRSNLVVHYYIREKWASEQECAWG